MQYIADADGYLLHVSFGGSIECGDTCTEYTGQIPSGYTSMEDWYLDNADELYKWAVLSDGSGLIKDSSVPDRAPGGEVDYIVEEGTANNWNYRKWNSGWAECWRTLSISNYACNTAVGSWYRTSLLTSAAYPFTFTATPNLQMFFETATGTSGLVWSAGTSSDDDDKSRPHKFYIIRMMSSDSISGKVHFRATGKWK